MNGWGCPKIVPFEDLEVDPRCEGLGYSVQGFEGMKAYKDKDD